MNCAGKILIRMSLLWVAIAIVLPFPGCETETAPPVKLYEGPEKPLAELAILRYPYKTVHLLPGEHTVYLSQKEPWKAQTFLARAGHTYEVAVYSYTMITVRNDSTAIWGIYDKTAKRWVVP